MQKVIDYINKKTSEGLSLDVISANLVGAGWSKEIIEKSIFITKNPDIPVPDMVPVIGQASAMHQDKSSAPKSLGIGLSLWDTFEYILMFISLYAFVIALIILLNDFVNIFIPDKLNYSYYGRNTMSPFYWYDEGMRMNLSTIIVSFPFFSFLFLRNKSRTLSNPALAKMASRKVLIYMTLILTFVTLLVSLIMIIFGLLNGDLTSNSIGHFAVTIGVCATVFVYFLNTVKNDRQNA